MLRWCAPVGCKDPTAPECEHPRTLCASVHTKTLYCPVQATLTLPGLLAGAQVRVRLGVGDCLQVLAQQRGAAVYEACHQRILESIYENFVSAAASATAVISAAAVGATAALLFEAYSISDI